MASRCDGDAVGGGQFTYAYIKWEAMGDQCEKSGMGWNPKLEGG